MTVCHIVRCDNAGCGTETPLGSSKYSEMAYGMALPTQVPEEWKTIGHNHFCSWKCVRDFASEVAG